jgi:hypothetical protein
VYSNTIREILPLNHQVKEVKIPAKNRAGEHNLVITFDAANEIDELYEDDNSVVIRYNVQTSSVRAIVTDSLKVINNGSINLLNSVKAPTVDTILIRISSSPNFANEQVYKIKFDTLSTNISFENLNDGKRYWYKTSFATSPDEVFETKSFVYDNTQNYNFAVSDSISTLDFSYQNTVYKTDAIVLSNDNIPLVMSSAGFEPGGIAKIELDNVDYAYSVGCGHNIVVMDEATLQFEVAGWFNYWDNVYNYEAYLQLLTTIGPDKIIAVSIAGECGGYNPPIELIDKLKEFGSFYIDSVGWGTSWVFVGKLGAPVGTMPEEFSRTETVYFDTNFIRTNLNGLFAINKIKNAAKWDSIFIDADSFSYDDQLIVKPIIHREVSDTLDQLVLSGLKSDLSVLNDYPGKEVSFLFEISADNQGVSPNVNAVKIKYDLFPELGTNYQVVSSSADSVLVGENIRLSFYVYNVGETAADSFNVKVDVINSDNSRSTIFTQLVESLEPENKKMFELTYNTSLSIGSKTFLIDIDSDKKVKELFEDNNFYAVPFFIKPDTSKPSLQVSFDGGDILDGDYISPNPEIRMELTDETLLPITDTTAITIFLNDEPVYYANNQSVLSIDFNEQNPKAVVTYKPQLEDGAYSLTVFGKNSLGSVVDSSGLEKRFMVSNEAKLLNVYNFPNPTAGETHFTFKLTRIPDKIKIRIFTIAGRLIKEIEVPPADLKYDFNKIYWDGKDEDGDIVGNGVYLYKVILTAGEKTEDVIQKLAIVR